MLGHLFVVGGVGGGGGGGGRVKIGGPAVHVPSVLVQLVQTQVFIVEELFFAQVAHDRASGLGRALLSLVCLVVRVGAAHFHGHQVQIGRRAGRRRRRVHGRLAVDGHHVRQLHHRRHVRIDEHHVGGRCCQRQRVVLVAARLIEQRQAKVVLHAALGRATAAAAAATATAADTGGGVGVGIDAGVVVADVVAVVVVVGDFLIGADDHFFMGLGHFGAEHVQRLVIAVLGHWRNGGGRRGLRVGGRRGRGGKRTILLVDVGARLLLVPLVQLVLQLGHGRAGQSVEVGAVQKHLVFIGQMGLEKIAVGVHVKYFLAEVGRSGGRGRGGSGARGRIGGGCGGGHREQLLLSGQRVGRLAVRRRFRLVRLELFAARLLVKVAVVGCFGRRALAVLGQADKRRVPVGRLVVVVAESGRLYSLGLVVVVVVIAVLVVLVGLGVLRDYFVGRLVQMQRYPRLSSRLVHRGGLQVFVVGLVDDVVAVRLVLRRLPVAHLRVQSSLALLGAARPRLLQLVARLLLVQAAERLEPAHFVQVVRVAFVLVHVARLQLAEQVLRRLLRRHQRRGHHQRVYVELGGGAVRRRARCHL
ncbi:hypothetical protein BpHYR1_047775 [Brachionus plicatilis]|uniref:Uncharacterized protein n=1 Tax=Brachionus plicatilis TaxID=10195 RepID=A0A3M7T842_BRAPC|nr:hypothetical protein BpHYR1_047775 [Brachionus plicatilis]